MRPVYTQRCFARLEFEDRYNQCCSLQKSSLAFEDCIWFGVDEGIPDNVTGEREEIMGRMHLTRDMVRELLPVLQHFADTGELD